MCCSVECYISLVPWSRVIFFVFNDDFVFFRWVNENIEHFGGDKGNVTIFGESAGGISCHMHMLSTLSKDLFHKAISHSGVATCTSMCTMWPLLVTNCVSVLFRKVCRVASSEMI